MLSDRQIVLPACLFVDELHPPLDCPFWLFRGTGCFYQGIFICSWIASIPLLLVVCPLKSYWVCPVLYNLGEPVNAQQAKCASPMICVSHCSQWGTWWISPAAAHQHRVAGRGCTVNEQLGSSPCSLQGAVPHLKCALLLWHVACGGTNQSGLLDHPSPWLSGPCCRARRGQTSPPVSPPCP